MTRVPPGPVGETIPPRKQAAARHYGSHQYYTKRAWNVVRAYIAHFTAPGETVLDPFGGSGVTAIEALALGRRAVHVDVCPFSTFLARQVARAPVDLDGLEVAYRGVEAACRPELEAWAALPDAEAARLEPRDWFPRHVSLPPDGDVARVEDLFSPRQLASLARLLAAVEAVADPVARDLLRYAFSATLYKCNRTFLSVPTRAASRGGSAIFSLYRYKVARRPVELPVFHQFSLRFRKLLACKADTNREIGASGGLVCALASATSLPLADASIDYAFTDPPYGGHIAYLDLGTLFHAWLRLDVPAAARRLEAIEGGRLDLDRAHYVSTLHASAREIARVLRPGRWASVVYAHRDLAYWQALVDAFESAGLHLVATIPQPLSVVWSMRKKKNPGTALAGEVILSFAKDGARRARAAGAARDAHRAILALQEGITGPSGGR